jgi:uncharacterized protein with PIN domain
MAGTIKFYTDEHVPNAVARSLRAHGVDVRTTADAGMLGSSDEDQLEWAKNEGRVMFSQDRDFLRLAATIPDHAGVAYASRAMPLGSIINGLMLIHGVLEPAEMVGRVEYL